MHISSRRFLTLLLGGCVLWSLTAPRLSVADPYGYGEGAHDRPWGAMQHERAELEQAYTAHQRDWERLQHERQEMHEARWVGDWRAYEHERREAEEAAEAVRQDRAHIAHEQRELWQQQHRWHHRAWDDD